MRPLRYVRQFAGCSRGGHWLLDTMHIQEGILCMTMTKRIITMLWTAVMLLTVTPVTALAGMSQYEPCTENVSRIVIPFGDVHRVPSAFWAINTPYLYALSANDHRAIAAHGRRVIEFWLGSASAEGAAFVWGNDTDSFGFKINSIWSVSNAVARSYHALGDRQGALWANRVAYAFVDAYQALTPQIGGNPDDMEFARMRIRNTIIGLEATASVFAQMRDGSGEVVYFGALHEPRSGVFFGEPGIYTVMDGPARPSAVTIYVEFEHRNLRDRIMHDLRWNELMHGYSRYDFSIIQVAWNFLYEGYTPADVLRQEQHVRESAQFLGELGLPILLRIGAEMDVWETPGDPDEFIAAFRFIANIMRQYAPNVAMVYSVNSVSAQGIDWMTFFPGDDYVDWVGISLYTTRYFLGNPATTDVQAAIYRTGQFASPVSFIQQMVDEFGDRFPLLISEGGVSLYNNSNSEDLTDWALPRMRQTYAYIPMLFPQVKAIFWFNVHIPGSNQRYDFAVSPRARELYHQLTSQENFLTQGQTSSPITFRELGYGYVTMPANDVTLLTYAPFFALDNVWVEYRLNGQWIGNTNVIPYRQHFDLTGLANGAHVLLVRVLDGDLELQRLYFDLIKNNDTVMISPK